MATLSAFSTPARVQDFPAGSPEQDQLDQLWSTRVDGFTQQAIVGDPWNSLYQSDQTGYYHPFHTDIPAGTAALLVSWSAFPNRIIQYLGQARQPPPNPFNFSDDEILKLADTGDGLQPIPQNRCPQADWTGPKLAYGPYGPRGWQDEYCEWSVTRDDAGKIVRVDLVCENPEYWYTLWNISPDRVAELYAQTLSAGAPHPVSVTVEDLQLVDPSTGQPVIDPSTGRPAYNPLNKFNRGPFSTRGGPDASGGAMHLTSTPNTLQTELALAGGATVLRQSGNQDPQQLICCAQYGQAYRNSDPHIGQQVNLLVSAGHAVSLADPVGLYMQAPNFGRYALPSDPKLPAGAKPADCWHVLRGAAAVEDPVTGQPYPGSMILHAAFQLPQTWIDAGVSFTVGDITIAGEPISWGGQIVRTMNIGLFPRPLQSSVPAGQPCVAPSQVVEVQPLQQFHAALWDAYYGTPEKNPVNEPMSLASNTVIVPPQVPQGAQQVALALTCSGVDGQPAPQVTFPPGGDLVATDVKLVGDVNYAVPGNSYPGPCQLLTFTLDVAADAQVGLRSLVVTNAGGASGEPAPAFLEVVPAGP